MTLNGLQVLFLRENFRDRGPSNFCRWEKYSLDQATHLQKPYLLSYKKEDICNALKNKHAPIEKVSKLYFDPISTYPRFKIKDTKFSRVIKLDNCDAVVVPDELPFKVTNTSYEIYKGETTVYIFSGDFIKETDPTIYKNIMKYGETFSDALRTIGTLPKDTKLVFSGELCFCESHLTQVLNNIVDTYKKYVTEKEVDEIVNKSLEKLTEESAISINDMLSSKDPSSVEIGLKILQGIDVLSTPLAVATLLFGNYQNISKNKAMATTGVSQIFKTLKINYVSPYFDKNLNMVFNDQSMKAATPEDRTLTLVIGREIITKHFSEVVRNLKQSVPGLPFNIKTYVE